MRIPVAAAAVAGLLAGAVAFQARQGPGARAEDPPGRQRVEYKVVFSPVEHDTVRERRTVDGKAKQIEHGPKASAEAMTKQFNALAADGWEYVGPLTSTGRQAPGSEASGVLTVFKRAKR
jgi:hypothetical protein